MKHSGTEVVVVRTPRDASLVVGLMGVLVSGGAYVPVDPEYPPLRQRMMLEDSGARLMVTSDERLLDELRREGSGASDARAEILSSFGGSLRAIVVLNRTGKVAEIISDDTHADAGADVRGGAMDMPPPPQSSPLSTVPPVTSDGGGADGRFGGTTLVDSTPPVNADDALAYIM